MLACRGGLGQPNGPGHSANSQLVHDNLCDCELKVYPLEVLLLADVVDLVHQVLQTVLHILDSVFGLNNSGVNGVSSYLNI